MGGCMSTPSEHGVREGRAGGTRHELQRYDPVIYVPDETTIRDPQRLVSRVHFIAQDVLQMGGNHWLLYFQTGATESVSINMHPSNVLGAASPGHGYRGQMTITHQGHATSRNQQYSVVVPATRGHPVAHFIDAIIDAGNHEYDFTTEGRGCTGWIVDQSRLFRQLGLVPPEFDAIEDAIELQWFGGSPTGQRPITRGFYMKDTRGGGWSAGTQTPQ